MHWSGRAILVSLPDYQFALAGGRCFAVLINLGDRDHLDIQMSVAIGRIVEESLRRSWGDAQAFLSFLRGHGEFYLVGNSD